MVAVGQVDEAETGIMCEYYTVKEFIWHLETRLKASGTAHVLRGTTIGNASIVVLCSCLRTTRASVTV